ncbi:MAG: 30S ribosomal protein S2 [Chthoniobacterales bacterium]
MSTSETETKPVSVDAITELLEAGVHYGHQTKRWNPKMRDFILEEHNSIYIIDLEKTVAQLKEATDFLSKTVKGGGKVLFVGTKKQAQGAIREAAEATNQLYVNERWLGGTLTNLETMRKSVARLKDIQGRLASKNSGIVNKKEAAALRREANKLDRNLKGLINMEKLPDALVIIDTPREQIAVAEANRLNIPVVAIVDTNSDPDNISYPIPGNDDAIRSIRIILQKLVDAIVQSKRGFEKVSDPELAAVGD